MSDRWLTLDSLCQIGFGKQLHLLDKPNNRFILDVLHSFSNVMRVYVQFPELSKLHLEKLVQIIPGSKAAQRKYENWSNEFGASILKSQKSSQPSLFSTILNSEDQKIQAIFPESELWAEGVFLMLAGEWFFRCD